MKSYKHLYNLSLTECKQMHFAAHSHHPWPDCTFEAHQQYWRDSVHFLDKKWDYIFSKVVPQVQKNIAEVLNLSNSEMIAIAPNTHEFVARLFSCFDKKIKVLTTDSEFHSFRRQIQRLIEADRVEAVVIPVEPYETFSRRWTEEVSKNYDMIFTSQVFFNSGLTCPDLDNWVHRASKEAMIVVDGYHAFCAVPTNLKEFEDRIFYLAGGYKYAQGGEGVCFLACPKNNIYRPINTGWFASFETLNEAQKEIQYSSSGMRFWGSTFDASGCYRINSVFDMFKRENLTTQVVHERVNGLKNYFISNLNGLPIGKDNLIYSGENIPEAHFVTFKTHKAQEIEDILYKNGILVDSRADRLRFGFGIYHDKNDIDLLIKKLENILKS